MCLFCTVVVPSATHDFNISGEHAQVVATIRQAADGPAAAAALQAAFGLSSGQTEGVLSLSLRRLTSLEVQKLQQEADALNARSAIVLDMHLT